MQLDLAGLADGEAEQIKQDALTLEAVSPGGVGLIQRGQTTERRASRSVNHALQARLRSPTVHQFAAHLGQIGQGAGERRGGRSAVSAGSLIVQSSDVGFHVVGDHSH